jgi:hypothetical protein
LEKTNTLYYIGKILVTNYEHFQHIENINERIYRGWTRMKINMLKLFSLENRIVVKGLSKFETFLTGMINVTDFTNLHRRNSFPRSLAFSYLTVHGNIHRKYDSLLLCRW